MGLTPKVGGLWVPEQCSTTSGALELKRYSDQRTYRKQSRKYVYAK